MKAAALLVGLVSLVSVVQADSLRSEVEASNKRISSAMLRKDIPAIAKAIKAGCTADFKYTEDGRSQTFDQMMTGIKMGLGSMKKITVAEAKTVSLTEKGDTGFGTTDHRMGGIVMGADEKPHTMIVSGRSVDTYVKVNGVWKMSKMAWKSTSMTMDGKPMPMGKMDSPK